MDDDGDDAGFGDDRHMLDQIEVKELDQPSDLCDSSSAYNFQSCIKESVFSQVEQSFDFSFPFFHNWIQPLSDLYSRLDVGRNGI